MNRFESEDISLFEELYTGLSQAIEFTQGTCKAKVTLGKNNSAGFEAIYDEMYALRP